MNNKNNHGIEMLHTGMSDNANLMNEDQLGELFGGYCSNVYCGKGYEGSGTKCKKEYCSEYYK